MKRLLFGLLIFCCPAFASYECENSCECCEGPSTVWLSGRHKEANGIGYNRGYSSLDVFLCSNLSENWYSVLDLRGHIFNDGKWATNAGLGMRYLSYCMNGVLGLNVFWDWREASHFNFHQLGGGIELLFPCWDFHLNGYAPLTKQAKTYQKGFYKFSGNRAFFERRREHSFPGFDALVGRWIYDCGWFGVHGALGGYYFSRGSQSFGGGRFKAKLGITQHISLMGEASYDNKFKWVTQGEVAIHIPFGPKVKRYQRPVDCCDLIDLEYRLIGAIERFEIPPTATSAKTAAARNPDTKEPLSFFFVNNTSSGNGTFEAPFAMLAQAEGISASGDVIYIFPGDGTDTGQDSAIALKNKQSLVGSGAPFEVNTRFGTLSIPAQSLALPLISNSASMGSDTILLANQNTISGLNITSASGQEAIMGATVTGLTLLNSRLNTASGGADGILITTFAGGDLNVINTEIFANSEGVIVPNFNGRNFLFQNSSISTTAGQAEGIQMTNFRGDDFIFYNSTIETIGNNSEGILITNFLSGNFLAKNSRILSPANNGEAIQIDTFSGEQLILSGNEIRVSDNGAEALFIPNFNGSILRVENNTLETGSDGMIVTNFNSGQLIFRENQVTSRSEGITVNNFSGTDAFFLNNTMRSETGSDETIFFFNFLGRDLFVKGNTFITVGNDSSGVRIRTFEGRDFCAESNQFFTEGTGANGILITNYTGRNILIKENTILTTGNDAEGIQINNFTGEDITIERNTLSMTGANNPEGILLVNFNGRDFHLKENRISTEARAAEAFIISTFNGRDFAATGNTITTQGDIAEAIQIPTFRGRDFLVVDNWLETNGIGSEAIEINSFNGRNFVLHNNQISTQAVNVEGVFLNIFTGNFIINYNTISAIESMAIDITIAPGSNTHGQIQNNLFIGSGDSVLLDNDGALEAFILNNRFESLGSSAAFTLQGTGNARVRFWKNSGFAPSAGEDFEFNGSMGTIELQSPNADSSGVEAINDGRLDFTNVLFVPFDP